MDYDTINLLGLQPDDILDLNIVRNNDVIIISVTLTVKDYICPVCGSLHSQVKDYQLKKINHSIFNMNKTFIHYRCRRLKCVDCGKTFVENNPFTQHKQRISNAAILVVLKNCKRLNYTFDEFYLGKTWKNKFACIFIDWQTAQIIDIYPNRKKYDLYSYMQYINKEEFSNVQYVSIDMNPTYREFAYHHFKNVTVMVDSFHVVKNINDALKNLRIHVMYKFDRDSIEYYLLKQWNSLIMMRKGDIEDYTYDNAGSRYGELYNDLIKMNINEFKDVVSCLKNWRKEILNSFIYIGERRISNGPIESINGRIKILMKTSLKYKNFERLRNRIMFCINKDSLPIITNEKKTNKTEGKKRGKYNKNK